MSKYIKDLLSKIETPGTSNIREVKVMDQDATPTALTTMTPMAVTDITWIDGDLVIVIDTA